MRNTLIFAGLVLTASSMALAAPDKSKPAPTEIKCAVMTGRTVNIKAATASGKYADYKGNRYFFCCGGCPSAFKANPAKYAANAHIATPKPAKKA